MTIPDLSSRALAARTALLALCDALVSTADASHAGLAVPPPAPTPAPEAKRPTVIRLTSAHAGLPIDAACRVLAWHGDTPLVRGAPGYGDTYIGAGKWAPAPCPPPVAGRGETLPDDVRELLLDIEHAAKWANQPDAPEAMYVRIRLRELAACAHDILALSRPVRP